jgi:hypothetical protein
MRDHRERARVQNARTDRPVSEPAFGGRCRPYPLSVAKLPIACSLVGDASADRLDRWKLLLGGAVADRARIPNGVEIHFDECAAQALADLVAAERECCGWAGWDLSQAQGALVLRATASDPAGADVLRELFQV